MQDVLIVPDNPLYAFVDCFWFQQGLQTAHLSERVLPDGYAEVIINLHEDCLYVEGKTSDEQWMACSGSLLYGPHTRPFIIDRSRPTAILGIHFRPGGLAAFLPYPVMELRNQIVPLDAVWGQKSRELRNDLLSASSIESRFQILQRFLTARLQHSFTVHPAVTYTLHRLSMPCPTTHIGAIVEQLGMSSRRFSQVFQEQVGMTPKTYQRLRRFGLVLRALERRSHADWTDLALSCSYFDQAHFIHEFKEFCGMTPVLYWQQDGKRPGHVPVAP